MSRDQPKLPDTQSKIPDPIALLKGVFLSLAAGTLAVGTLAPQPATAQRVEQAPSTITGALPANVAPLTIAWALPGKNENLSVQEGYGRTPDAPTSQQQETGCGWVDHPATGYIKTETGTKQTEKFGTLKFYRFAKSNNLAGANGQSKLDIKRKSGKDILCGEFDARTRKFTGYTTEEGLSLIGIRTIDIITGKTNETPLTKIIYLRNGRFAIKIDCKISERERIEVLIGTD